MSEEKNILRFTTAGSVDDGKSTLIGRLLFDSNNVYEDQLNAIAKTSQRKQNETVDLSLLTDGLAAEREQGITIDVAYRYFSTPKRKFIIADTPGHEQYTRNMVTGASTANLSIILIDARKGLLAQSHRHAYIASLLGIKHVLVCINKMDLVNYSENIFNQIKEDFKKFASQLHLTDVHFIPVSALVGDNIVHPSENMPWYQGETVLSLLENIEIKSDRNFDDFRMFVQYVIRPNLDYRGFAGQIGSGVVKVGQTLQVLPSGKKSRVKTIDVMGENLTEAFVPQSICLTLEDEIDISRGDILVDVAKPCLLASDLQVMLCWMSETPLDLSKKYLLKHGTNTVKVMLKSMDYKVDVVSLKQTPATQLQLNEIAKVSLKTLKPLAYDSYQKNHSTGSFIIIDELSNNTVAAGMLL